MAKHLQKVKKKKPFCLYTSNLIFKFNDKPFAIHSWNASMEMEKRMVNSECEYSIDIFKSISMELTERINEEKESRKNKIK